MSKTKIVIQHPGNKDIADFLTNSLKQYNESVVGPYQRQPFVIYIEDAHQQIVGGLHGDILEEGCNVYVVWVHEAYREQGLGTQLFLALETFAQKNQCRFIHLDTAEFQAKGFYEKMGFEIIATLPRHFRGQDLYILRKYLNMA